MLERPKQALCTGGAGGALERKTRPSVTSSGRREKNEAKILVHSFCFFSSLLALFPPSLSASVSWEGERIAISFRPVTRLVTGLSDLLPEGSSSLCSRRVTRIPSKSILFPKRPDDDDDPFARSLDLQSHLFSLSRRYVSRLVFLILLSRRRLTDHIGSPEEAEDGPPSPPQAPLGLSPFSSSPSPSISLRPTRPRPSSQPPPLPLLSLSLLSLSSLSLSPSLPPQALHEPNKR